LEKRSEKKNIESMRARLQSGLVIPASPLALSKDLRLDARRQRALWRYYSAAGAGGIAVGVHTTQFAIRDPKIGLHRPLLELANDEMDRLDGYRDDRLVRVAGVCGETRLACAEAELAAECGFETALLNLGALKNATEDELIAHCRGVASIVPVFGFFLQPASGGRLLPYSFWRRFVEIENVVAIKVAAFNRYQTIDVMRAVAESGRDDIAMYTGNDDSILLDLITPYRFKVGTEAREVQFVGGLLGHWAVWTKCAVEQLTVCRASAEQGSQSTYEMLTLNVEVTDCNAAFFDAANGYKGCIAGLHEVLRRQGLLEGVWCLSNADCLSPGQAAEIDRVYKAYPHLSDDTFVLKHKEEWLRD
jgi:hypothetical protein